MSICSILKSGFLSKYAEQNVVTCMAIVDNERTLPRREGEEGLTVASRIQEPWVPTTRKLPNQRILTTEVLDERLGLLSPNETLQHWLSVDTSRLLITY